MFSSVYTRDDLGGDRGMSSILHQFIHHEVEIRFPLYGGKKEEKSKKSKKTGETRRDVGKVYHGVISKITENEVYILSPYNNDFTERDGNATKVRIIGENRPTLKFVSVTMNNYIHEDMENQIFIIKYPSKVNFRSRRSKPRVNTKIPSRFSLYSFHGKVFPLKKREKHFKSFILDVSETGVQIATVHRLPEGLRITLSFSYSPAKELDLDGDLVWRKKDRGLYRYGVKFINPSTDEKYLLRTI